MFLAKLREVAGDRRGAMIIETAIVAPVLILLSLGGFEVSQIVSRQHELQGGIAEAEAIALAGNVGAKTDTEGLKSVLMHSLSLSDEEVQVRKLYRCGLDDTLVESADECPEDSVVSSYARITLHDVYAPMWKSFGIARNFNFNVTRTVQLS